MASRNASGQFQPGGPSANPDGRGAPFRRAEIAKARSAPGHDGVIAYAGYVTSGERNSRTTGANKWVEYANAYNHPVVAIALLLRWALFSRVKWSLTPNASGTAAATKGVEVTQQGLLDARLPTPWNQVVAKAAMRTLNGFSIHATAMGRRKDGLVTFTDIAHRPPHTIERWWRAKKGDVGPFVTVEQRLTNGVTTEIDLGECLYLRYGAIGDGPDGPGILRLVLERLRRVDAYEGREGAEIFNTMGGMPIVRAPLEEIAAATPGDAAAKAAGVTSATATMREVAAERVKTPEKLPYMTLDSATYRGTDGNVISGVQKWAYEIVKGEQHGLAEIRKVITDEKLDVARVFGIEFVMLGGTDTGSFAMHESKIDMFVDTTMADVDDIAVCAGQQLVRRLCAANGLDPDEAAPQLVPSPIKRGDVMKAVEALVRINVAGLPPNHPAKQAVFEAVGLPWQEETDAGLMLPFGARGGLPFSGGPEREEQEPEDVDADEGEEEDVE